jgi:hypothetical protein
MRVKVSRSQLVRRLANLPACLVGLEAGSGSHHVARQIQALGGRACAWRLPPGLFPAVDATRASAQGPGEI